MTRLRSTRAISGNGSVTIQASTQLMDDFVYKTDLNGETDLVAVQQADGSYSLLYIGLSDNLMSLRQDDSDTGWSEEPLNNGFVPGQIVGAVDGGGTFTVFATGPNAAAPDIYVSTRGSNGSWAPWQPVAPDANVPPFMQVTNLAAIPAGGAVHLFALLGPSPDGSATPGLWQVAWNGASPVWTHIADSDQTILEPYSASASAPGLLFANTAAASPVQLDLFAVSISATLAPQPLAQSLSFNAIATGMQASGSSAVFIADQGNRSGTRQIQYLDGANPGNGFVQIDTSIAASSLAVASAGASPLALFILDQTGSLRLIADPQGVTPGDEFDLSIQLNGILCATDRDGNAELIGYAPSQPIDGAPFQGLIRLFDNPSEGPEAPGGWTRQPIEYSNLNQTLTQQSTYSTTLTFFDANGAALANQALNLSSTEVTGATVAGEFAVLGPNTAVACRTDPAGRIRITAPTQALNAAQLSATLPGLTMDGEDFAIAPDAGAKNRLAAITVAEVTQLVPAKYASSAADIQKTVKEAMSQVSDGRTAVVRRRTQRRPDLKTPIHSPKRRRRSHRFSVTGDRATFRVLTPRQAQARFAAIEALPEFGLFDFFEDAIDAIGDAISDAATWTYDHVIKPVVDGIKVAITFVSDAVQVAWSGIVDTVEDAFRFVQTVFEAVATFFKDLYNFLAWLFGDARKDIMATKKQLETLVTTGSGLMAGYAAQGASIGHTFFADLENTISQAFAQIEASLGTTDAAQAIGASLGSQKDSAGDTLLEIIEDAAAVANWLIDKLTPSIGIGLDFTIDLPAALQQGANALLTLAQSVVQQLLAMVTDLVGNLSQLATSAGSFGSVLLKTLLDEAKTLILGILAIVDTLVQGFLNFMSTNLPAITSGVFGAVIGSSFIQALYDLFNPGESEDLTVVGLAALLCAFPATVIYRIFFGAAPFSSSEGEAEASGAANAAGVWLIVAGLIQTSYYMFVDAFADFQKTSLGWYWLNLVLVPVFLQLATWPGGPFTQAQFDTPQQKATWTAWFTAFSTPLYKIVWGVLWFFNIVAGGPRSTMPGSAGLALCGATTLGVNAWMCSVINAGIWQWIASIATPLSPMSKPLKFGGPLAKEALLPISLVSDEAGGIARIMRGAELTGQDTARLGRAA